MFCLLVLAMKLDGFEGFDDHRSDTRVVKENQ
jgi:hypothetical protein